MMSSLTGGPLHFLFSGNIVCKARLLKAEDRMLGMLLGVWQGYGVPSAKVSLVSGDLVPFTPALEPASTCWDVIPPVM